MVVVEWTCGWGRERCKIWRLIFWFGQLGITPDASLWRPGTGEWEKTQWSWFGSRPSSFLGICLYYWQIFFFVWGHKPSVLSCSATEVMACWQVQLLTHLHLKGLVGPLVTWKILTLKVSSFLFFSLHIFLSFLSSSLFFLFLYFSFCSLLHTDILTSFLIHTHIYNLGKTSECLCVPVSLCVCTGMGDGKEWKRKVQTFKKCWFQTILLLKGQRGSPWITSCLEPTRSSSAHPTNTSRGSLQCLI